MKSFQGLIISPIADSGNKKPGSCRCRALILRQNAEDGGLVVALVVHTPALALFIVGGIRETTRVTKAHGVVLIHIVEDRRVVAHALVIFGRVKRIAITSADIKCQSIRERYFCARIKSVVREMRAVVVQLFAKSYRYVGQKEHADVKGFLDFEFKVIADGVAASRAL